MTNLPKRALGVGNTPAPAPYTPGNWYWAVAGIAGYVFSSARASWVLSTDATYVAWAAGPPVHNITKIDSTASLVQVLQGVGLIQAAAVAAYDPTSLIAQQQAAAAQIAAARWALVAGGVTINGFPFATDLEARANWDSIYLAALGNSALTIQWKLVTGAFLFLNATQIIAIGQALVAFGQTAFNNEEALLAQINALTTIAGVQSLDLTTGWPSPVITIPTTL